jgi:hypothetical protein
MESSRNDVNNLHERSRSSIMLSKEASDKLFLERAYTDFVQSPNRMKGPTRKSTRPNLMRIKTFFSHLKSKSTKLEE